jgi:hypothetical protein
MFRSSTIVWELVLSLAKVMFKHLCPYWLCGGVAACLGTKTETCRSDVYVNFSVKLNLSKFNK